MKNVMKRHMQDFYHSFCHAFIVAMVRILFYCSCYFAIFLLLPFSSLSHSVCVCLFFCRSTTKFNDIVMRTHAFTKAVCNSLFGNMLKVYVSVWSGGNGETELMALKICDIYSG